MFLYLIRNPNAYAYACSLQQFDLAYVGLFNVRYNMGVFECQFERHLEFISDL